MFGLIWYKSDDFSENSYSKSEIYDLSELINLMGECRYTLTMSCYARIEHLIILFDAEIERQCYLSIS